MSFLTLIMFFLIISKAQALCVGVGCSCSLAMSGLNFGTYNPFSSSAPTASATISVTCQALVLNGAISYQVQFSAGGSGNMMNRQLTYNSNTLNYNIFNDSSYTQIIGNGVGSTTQILSSYILTISPYTQTFTVYAQLPVQPLAAAGTYQDQITATLTY